ATRRFMESRFNHDFSQVRLHTDPQAAESARAVNAHAYTVGRDVVFAADRYRPESDTGRALLAHELAHVVQQRGLQPAACDLPLSAAEDASLEREADAAARAVTGGGPSGAIPTRLSAPVLSRAAANVPAVGSAQKKALRDEGFEEMDPPPQGVSGIRRFRVIEAFPLPGTKGPAAKAVWQARARAKEGGLEAVIDADGNSVLKQQRPGP